MKKREIDGESEREKEQKLKKGNRKEWEKRSNYLNHNRERGRENERKIEEEGRENERWGEKMRARANH